MSEQKKEATEKAKGPEAKAKTTDLNALREMLAAATDEEKPLIRALVESTCPAPAAIESEVMEQKMETTGTDIEDSAPPKDPKKDPEQQWAAKAKAAEAEIAKAKAEKDALAERVAALEGAADLDAYTKKVRSDFPRSGTDAVAKALRAAEKGLPVDHATLRGLVTQLEELHKAARITEPHGASGSAPGTPSGVLAQRTSVKMKAAADAGKPITESEARQAVYREDPDLYRSLPRG